MRVSRAFALFAVVLTMGGCQTLTEELPTQSTSTVNVIPPFVQPPPAVPVPIPEPESPGGAPPPTNQNPPPGGGGPPGQIPNNFNPVAKVGAKVYFLECNGQQVPGSEFATEAQVGCRIHFDCTPKDANNDPTQAQSAPEWSFSPGSLVQVGNVNDFTPTATAKNAGDLTVFVRIDGITSNTLNIRIYN